MEFKNKDNKRIAKTYETYTRLIDEDMAKGYITQKLTIEEYVQAYKDLEMEMKATNKSVGSKSAYIARESRIFTLKQVKEIKLRAQDSPELKISLGIGNMNVKKMSLHGFMKKLQERGLDRLDLWNICLEIGGEDYDAAKAMYNGVID